LLKKGKNCLKLQKALLDVEIANVWLAKAIEGSKGEKEADLIIFYNIR
jgi:hypothetical protein